MLLLRQSITPEARALRSPVKATVRSMEWRLCKDKLPVRGIIATTMYFSAVAMMVNLRRIHASLQKNTDENDVPEALLRLIFWLLALLKPWWTPPGRSGALPADRKDNAFIFPSNFSLRPLSAQGAA